MKENPLNNKRIAKNTVFLYLRMFFVLLVTLYTTRVVINALGVIDYGIYNVVCGFVVMFTFLNTSLSQSLQRFYNYEFARGGKDALMRVFNTSYVIQVGLLLFLFLIVETIGFFWFNYELEIPFERRDVAWVIFQFSVASMLINVLCCPYTALVLSMERMDYYALVTVIDAAVKLFVALSLPFVPVDKLLYYGGLLLTVGFLNICLYFLYCKKEFPYVKHKICIDIPLLRSITSFSGWNLLGSMATLANSQGIHVLLNAFFGVIVNASSGIAAQVSSGLSQLAVNVVIAFRPQLVTAYSRNYKMEVQNMMFIMSKIGFALAFTIALPVLLEMDYLLSLWLGNAVPEQAAIFSSIAVITVILANFNTPVTQVMHATGKIKKYQIITSIITCMILPISWCFFKIGFDAKTIFWVSLFMTIVNQLCALFILHAEFKYDVKKYLTEVIGSCVFMALVASITPCLVSYMMNSTFLRLTLVCLCSVLNMVILGYYFLLNNREKNMVAGLIKRKFKINKD
ncbi:MAG: hypothetical protein IIV53_02995 [Bacteroidaceae bacterium]|nr:hypothetical protein [Bacteroidaceae bacterium]